MARSPVFFPEEDFLQRSLLAPMNILQQPLCLKRCSFETLFAFEGVRVSRCRHGRGLMNVAGRVRFQGRAEHLRSACAFPLLIRSGPHAVSFKVYNSGAQRVETFDVHNPRSGAVNTVEAAFMKIVRDENLEN